MDLRHIRTEDVFGPSLGRVCMSRSKAKVTRDKNALSTAITPPGSAGMECVCCE